MDRSKFKVPEQEVKKQRPAKPDSLSGISLPSQNKARHKNDQPETSQVDYYAKAKLDTHEKEQQDLDGDNLYLSADGSVQPALPETEEETGSDATASEAEEDYFPKPTLSESLQAKQPSHYLGSNGDFNLRPTSKFYLLWDELAVIKAKYLPKISKRYVIIGSTVIFIGVIVLAVALMMGDDKGTSTNHESISQSQQSVQTSGDAVRNADFIVFGPVQGSLFYAERPDYQLDVKTGSIAVEAKSTIASDVRRISISEQKVPSNFETDPYGLKNLLASVGDTYKLSTKTGTSYIVKAYITGLAVRGETLIFVRTTAELTSDEWIAVFDSLQPIVITELGL